MISETNGWVLVVEDDDDIRTLLVQCLTDEGFRADSARNGREALDLLSGGGAVPAVILLDLMMPVLDGSGFRRRQLVDPALAPIPVVLLTADPQVEARAVELGVEDRLGKPVDLDVLFQVVGRFVRRTPSVREFCSPAPEG